MGQHKYCRIVVDGIKDHSTGGTMCKRIHDEINRGVFDPLKYVDHARFAPRTISIIDIYYITSSNSKRYRRYEKVVSFMYRDGKQLLCVHNTLQRQIGDKLEPMVYDKYSDLI